MAQQHILVIEDDSDIRETLRQILEVQGYQVTTASHGREGLEALEHGLRPNLILLDLMMPVMNGWEFLTVRKERDELTQIPIVILSAVRNPEQQSGLAGYPFVKKPLDLDVLLNTVEQNAEAAPA